MFELRNKAIQFIYDVFAKDCLNDEKLKFEGNHFNSVVNKAFNELILNRKINKNPYLIKLGGQSGSGKTTQLLPAIKDNLDKIDRNYVHIAVRFFAKFHPYYNELLEKYGEGLIREKTNGFALLCLFAVAEKLIKNKYNVLFEVTLLDPSFEEYFARLSKSMNYNVIYNVLLVPFEISNFWVKNRLYNSNYEKNRIVPESTQDYFYKVLPIAIEKILNIHNIFEKNDYVVLWDIFDEKPVLVSNNFEKEILNIFNQNRFFKENELSLIKDEKIALDFKKKFYMNFFKNLNIFN